MSGHADLPRLEEWPWPSGVRRAKPRTQPRPPLYWVWHAMRNRCLNPRVAGYRNYGGRGITVCEAWLDSATFIADIERLLGPRPPGMSLDRIDNDGPYAPWNVRWATAAQQRANRRDTVR